MLGWLDNDPNARCVPIHCLPTFSPKARYANPASRRSERDGWRAGIRQVRAWLDAAGRSEQLLLCVGDGRGGTKALGQWDLPRVVCCVRTRRDSRRCDLPSEAASGRGRPRVYSEAQWAPKQQWQQRTGWRRVPLTVRGRALRLLVKVLGLCRRVRWGTRVFFLWFSFGGIPSARRGASRASRWRFGFTRCRTARAGGQLPVPLEVLLLELWQRWEIEVGFRQMKSGFGLGQKPCWGLDSGERSVAWSA
jgi:hypothetical protein